MRLILLRHGESRSNAAPGRVALADREGDRLTEAGREQARAAAAWLRGLAPARLITSPLGRAQETAAIVSGELGLEAEIDPDLAELRESQGYGELEPREQQARRWSTWMSEHGDDPGYSWRGAESFEAVVARVRRLKARLAGSPQAPVLAVSHGILMRFFFADTLLGDRFGPDQVMRLWQLGSINCGVCVFEHSTAPAQIKDPAADAWRCVTWMCDPGPRG